MRMHILAAIIALAAPVAAFAQPTPARPATPAPTAAASFEQREAWCQTYASWLLTYTPSRTAAPSDVRPTQRFETEFNSCKLDPQTYERETRLEAQRITQSLRG